MLFFGDASQMLTPGAVHMLLVLALVWWWCPRWSRPGRSSRLRMLISLAFVWTWVFSTPAIANLALIQLEGKPAADSVTAIKPAGPATYVVMGAGTPASANADQIAKDRAQLTLAGWRRMEAAVGHWRSHGGQLVLVGGLANPSAPEASSLAGTMRSLARQWGVPDRAISAAGHTSQNTREDLLAAKTVLGKTDSPGALDGTPTYLVTSAAHMPRSIGVAKALGLTLTPLPTDWRQLNNPGWRAWFPNNGGPTFWQLSLYELLGTIVYQWRGWL